MRAHQNLDGSRIVQGLFSVPFFALSHFSSIFLLYILSWENLDHLDNCQAIAPARPARSHLELLGMATIRIAEELRPTRSQTSVGGGVYPIRAASLERSRTRSRSRDARSRLSDLKDSAIEEAGLRQDGDFKKKQVCLIDPSHGGTTY